MLPQRPLPSNPRAQGLHGPGGSGSADAGAGRGSFWQSDCGTWLSYKSWLWTGRARPHPFSQTPPLQPGAAPLTRGERTVVRGGRARANGVVKGGAWGGARCLEGGA